MFLKDFLLQFSSGNPMCWVNAYSVDRLGNTFTIRTTDEIEQANAEVVSLKKDLEGEEEWRKELQKEVEDKTREIDELEHIVKKFNEEGVNVRGLMVENSELIKQIAEWRKNSLALEEKIEKLQARKNKAIVERDFKTGKLIAEFQGIKYNLEKL